MDVVRISPEVYFEAIEACNEVINTLSELAFSLSLPSEENEFLAAVVDFDEKFRRLDRVLRVDGTYYLAELANDFRTIEFGAGTYGSYLEATFAMAHRCYLLVIAEASGSYENLQDRGLRPCDAPAVDQKSTRPRLGNIASALDWLAEYRSELSTLSSELRAECGRLTVVLGAGGVVKTASNVATSPTLTDVQTRNDIWRAWYYTQDEATYHSPANIRDKWNTDYPERRIGGGNSGRDLVNKGIRESLERQQK